MTTYDFWSFSTISCDNLPRIELKTEKNIIPGINDKLTVVKVFTDELIIMKHKMDLHKIKTTEMQSSYKG